MAGSNRRNYGFMSRQLRRAGHKRAETELDLRRAEIDLLRRQTRASWATVFSTLMLSTALLILTYFQWKTAESTATIERAKARPHFRIQQENQNDELGFLPHRFRIEADAGVSDATEATATSNMIIHFESRDLGLRGICPASFSNFYGWTNDAMSFEINYAAERFLNFSRRPDTVSQSYIRLQPTSVLIRVTFIDIFGNHGWQGLILSGGQTLRLDPGEFDALSRDDLQLVLQVENPGRIVVFRINGVLSRDCANAIAVMRRIPWIRIAREDEAPQDTRVPFTAQEQDSLMSRNSARPTQRPSR